jgi:methylated-DNA-[protein]-cysteine S-methyltransferase
MAATKRATDAADELLVFSSDLGWMAAVVGEGAVKQLTFGHASAAAAKRSLNQKSLQVAKPSKANARLVKRLQAYAAGTPDALCDISVDWGPVGDFQRRVLEQCRRIPYGRTMSYGQLAAKAGSPRAARAVGNCMATNKIPLLVPCHRVVCSGGRLGSYSAPGGTTTKQRLLAMESHEIGLELRNDSGQNAAAL